MAGYTESDDGDIISNHGDYDMWVVKLNKNGEIEWQKCLGGSGEDEANSIQQTTDGGYIVAGSTVSDDGDVSDYHGEEDMWIVKLDSTGKIEWQKCLGGSNYDYANSIKQTTDGGYIVAVSTVSDDGDVIGNHGSLDMWIVKLNKNGEIDWQKCLGGSDDDRAFSIQQTTDSGYIVAGKTFSDDGDAIGNHGDYDMWIVKLNKNGEIEK